VCNDGKTSLVDKLSRSQIYQDYEKAFGQTTGLPLSLRPVEVWQLAHQGKTNQNPFCALMGKGSGSCAACLQSQRGISGRNGEEGPQTVVCFAGLCETAVPVKIGRELVGYLQTGQVLLKKPTTGDFNRISRKLIEWGLTADLGRIEEAYFQTRVLSREQLESVARLVSIFAQHLSLVGNQVMVREEHAEPPNITRARQFIHEHQTEDLTLARVAQAVNTSTYYFCKMFKKTTGLHFTDYLSRVRVEKAKNLLINPNLRVSEIAYEVGFQSLTHFNRVFRKMAGESPSAYRGQLPGN
jgi:AraC-like DNA-binding protein/ligand-binding sensor protein